MVMPNTPRRQEGARKAGLSKHGSWAREIIPDSEEERQKVSISTEIIEISSDEEDTLNEDTPLNDAVLSMPGCWPTHDRLDKQGPSGRHLGKQDLGQNAQAKDVKATPRKLYRARRIVESSGSEDSDAERKVQANREIMELSDSTPERPIPSKGTPKRIKDRAAAQVERSLYSDEESASDDDGAILTLNEPKTARKPLRLPSLIQGRAKMPETTIPGTKRLQDLFNESDGRITLDPRPTPVGTPTRRKMSAAPSTPLSTSKAGTKPKQAPGTERKPNSVFKNGVPKDTKLNWSKRLLTTAGKARWHRSREGVQTTEIELAEKILDCDERIRNTLSHEMCHLASWIIDADPKEGHGRLWKAWTSKVMHRCPEIEITTRHDYEISYTYEWKCMKCAKIYGRFSKSIRVDECVCGACKEGRLTPLFATRAPKTPKTPKSSRMASTKPQDSPHSLPRPAGVMRTELGSTNDSEHVVYTIHDSDSEPDSDLAVLTTAMGSVTLIASETS
ncbi:SprT-like family-domain-containing protein [Lyophyllum atratum]|nr:SprT-like family-domain-containing protein [Lyophyllum atratum]